MAVNGMSVGRDYALAYYDADSGQIIDLGDVQNVRITAAKHTIKSQPYNNVPKFGFIPDGYMISFTITRTGPDLENFQLQANTRFNAGNSTLAGFLNESISEADGSVSRYQYTGLVVWVGDIGEITREATVKMQVEAMASDKKPIS